MDDLLVWFEDFTIWFSETLVGLIDFLSGFVENLVQVVDLTSSFVLEIPSYLSWLPDEVLSVLMVAFGVVVIYKILGREG